MKAMRAISTGALVLAALAALGCGDGGGSGAAAPANPIPPIPVLPKVNWTLAQQSVGEATGSFTVTAALPSAAIENIYLPFVVSGTATKGADYAMSAPDLTIPPGQASASLTVTLLDDAARERDETLIITLGDTLNALPGNVPVQTVTIVDNDPDPTVSWNAATRYASEEMSGALVLAATLSAPTFETVTVPITLAGSATEGVDYLASGHSLVFPPGSTSQAITLTLQDDAIDEPSEKIILDMGSPTHATRGGTASMIVYVTSTDAIMPAAILAPGAVYLADANTPGINELFAVSYDGTRIARLSTPLKACGSIVDMGWSPDRKNVAFTVSRLDDTHLDLYVVPSEGGAVTMVGWGRGDGSITSFKWSPDSARLLYELEPPSHVRELWTVRADSTGTARVSGLLPGSAGSAIWYDWAPDASRVAYLTNRIYSSKPDGTLPADVSGPTASGGHPWAGAFRWSLDGSRILYLSDANTPGLYELFIGLADGSDRVRVSALLTAGETIDRGFTWEPDFTWAPDSSRILYRTLDATNAGRRQYVALRDGSLATPVSPVVAGFSVGSRAAWSPDSSRVALSMTNANSSLNRLYIVAPDGSGPINVPLPAGLSGGIRGFAWSPTGARLAYKVNVFVLASLSFHDELCTVTVDGGDPVVVSGPMTQPGGVFTYSWSPDATKLLYFAVQDTPSTHEVYVSAATGSAGNIKVSGTLVAGGGLQAGPQWNAAGSRILYAGDQITDGVTELFASLPVAPPGNLRISAPLVAGGSVRAWQVR